MSLFSPTSLLVFNSETTSERTLGVIFSTISGMGSISFPLKYFAYLGNPVLFIVCWSLLLAFPGCGAFLGRLYRAILASICILRFGGDRQRRPICPYQALRFIWVTLCISWSCCPLHGCEKNSSQEGINKPPTVASMEGGSTVEQKKYQIKEIKQVR